MNFTKEQLSDVFVKHLHRKKGLQELIEIMIESMMRSERRDFLDANPDNKGNGYRQGKNYGQGMSALDVDNPFENLENLAELHK